jgi:hypothetical protein
VHWSKAYIDLHKLSCEAEKRVMPGAVAINSHYS